MSSLPFEVHEVLEQEYVAMYGPLEVPPPEYGKGDIIDEAWGRAVCDACGVDCGAGLVPALNALVASQDLNRLRESPAITDTGCDLIDHYSDYTDGVTDARRREINRRIVDDAFLGAVKLNRDIRLSALYTKLHARSDEDARTALSISGGGIRTATFALGIIQGLAGARILDKFHYLSTVSGGGYIGSWLSSWARRHPSGIAGVQDDLVRADTAVEGTQPQKPKSDRPVKKVDPEPRPLRHLRAYSNYMSPKLGFLSADTWTMASMYVRNLLLNLLVLIPILAAILAIPRLFAMLLRHDTQFPQHTLLIVAAAALAVGFGYLGASRPTVHGRHASAKSLRGTGGFFAFCAIPLTAASAAVSLYWAKIAELPFKPVLQRDWIFYAIAAAAMTLFPAAIYYYRFFINSSAAERREPLERQHGKAKKLATELVATLTGLASVVTLFYLVANKVFDHPVREVPDLSGIAPFLRGLFDSTPVSEIYVCFAVPIGLLIFFVQNAAFVGISSKVNEDYDREWWGRGGALLLMTAVILGLGCFIAVFGPVLLYRAPLLVSSVGGVSGLLAGLLGFSAKTPAGDKKDDKATKSSAASGLLLSLAVPLFVAVFLGAISLGTTVLIQLLRNQKVSVATKWVEQFQSNATVTQTAQTPAAKFETTYETEKVPFLSLATVNGVHHLKTVHATDRWDLLGILAVALAAAGLSTLVGVNRFSMQALYRNRLIRAYLGASRYSRDADEFTGFDPHDNLQMYELQPDLLWPTSFIDFPALVAQLMTNFTTPDSVEQTVWNALDRKTRGWLEDKRAVNDALKNAMMQNLNRILMREDLGGGVEGEPSAPRLRRNRATLQKAFGACLRPPQHAPMHVINTALNLTSGEKLAWQQRKAESFTVTPLHSGSFYVGYRDSKEYGGKDGISIGTAVAISGAAASPNQGYHSSPAMAFILTILNVRLGSWLGNPGLAGRNTYDNAHPRTNLEPLAWELTGMTNDQCPLVYLSDGGHFENLGIYEMVLRRCRFIVISDGGCDPKCSFEDLGNAIRKIRTDLGVPIDIEYDDMHPRSADSILIKGRYVTTARIRYSAIDEAPTEIVNGVERAKEIDGWLVYIKPGLYEGEYFPKDVYNYATESLDFPHETTADQFFSESQFESYRALGRHAFNEICGNYKSGKDTYAATYPTVAAFTQAAKANAPKMPPENLIADRITDLTTAMIRIGPPAPPPSA
jgi:patatin-like phospholipase